MQPIPDVTPADVQRVIRRDFGQDRLPDVVRQLEEYGKEAWEDASTRVRLAILKLANGDIDSLKRFIETAKRDYRDVLAYAEYPEYMQHSPANIAESKPEAVQKIIDEDWRQYQDWLRKT